MEGLLYIFYGLTVFKSFCDSWNYHIITYYQLQGVFTFVGLLLFVPILYGLAKGFDALKAAFQDQKTRILLVSASVIFVKSIWTILILSKYI